MLICTPHNRLFKRTNSPSLTLAACFESFGYDNLASAGFFASLPFAWKSMLELWQLKISWRAVERKMRRIYALYLCSPEHDARCGSRLTGSLSGTTPVAKLKTGELRLGREPWHDGGTFAEAPQALSAEIERASHRELKRHTGV